MNEKQSSHLNANVLSLFIYTENELVHLSKTNAIMAIVMASMCDAHSVQAVHHEAHATATSFGMSSSSTAP